VECKYWKTRIPQKEILALKQTVEDTGAHMGILVTKEGVQKGVKEYLAKHGNLMALTYKELASHVLGMDFFMVIGYVLGAVLKFVIFTLSLTLINFSICFVEIVIVSGVVSLSHSVQFNYLV